jgi:hypothetical protein
VEAADDPALSIWQQFSVPMGTRIDPELQTALTFRQIPGGEWNPERARHERSAAAAEHRHQMELDEAEHRREEERKDNDDRRMRDRIAFGFLVGVLVVVLVLGLTVGTQANNVDTRAWGQSLVTLIVGGIVGGFAGYVTRRSGK